MARLIVAVLPALPTPTGKDDLIRDDYHGEVTHSDGVDSRCYLSLANPTPRRNV